MAISYLELDVEEHTKSILLQVLESEPSLGALPKVGHCPFLYTHHISSRFC